MLNKEKYAKEILDIVCQDGTKPAVIDNVPIRCTNVSDCHDCKFYASNNCNDAWNYRISRSINNLIRRNRI